MAEYRQRVQRALEFIRSNLARPIRTAEIAKAASFSEYHFHRIFRSLMGETVGHFVTRHRLESAARMLAYQDDLSVTEIGLACGYSSSANFSKAFSSFFGISPSALRNPGEEHKQSVGVLKKRYGKDFSPSELYSLPELPLMAERLSALQGMLRFEERQAIAVVCISGSSGYEVAPNVRMWQKFVQQAMNLGYCAQDPELFGILHDDPVITADERCRYDACIRVEELPASPLAPLFCSQIPAGRFAIFHFQGPLAELDAIYRDIYSLWFPQSGLAPCSFPPIECYLAAGPDEDCMVDLELQFKTRSARG
ncbi:MAG: AraC family transcriptional regulator [Kofleriaceae bacterium]|nr:AraC family transcriptional regulator [Kofleriaceae bacterium]